MDGYYVFAPLVLFYLTSASCHRAQRIRRQGRAHRRHPIEHDPQYSAGDSGVHGLGEACVTFERPAGAEGADGGTELPSLFNPYWRASLATPSKRTRGEVGMFKGLPPIDAFFGGTSSCS